MLLLNGTKGDPAMSRDTLALIGLAIAMVAVLFGSLWLASWLMFDDFKPSKGRRTNGHNLGRSGNRIHGIGRGGFSRQHVPGSDAPVQADR